MGGMVRRLPALLLALALLLLAARTQQPAARAQQPAARDPLVVIVAHGTGLTNIATSLLRTAFRGEFAEYASGKRFLPLNHPPSSAERVAFDQAVLGLDSDAMGRFWIARRIRGEGFAPRAYPSASLGLRAVAAYPGAITYMRARQVTSMVRILTVDGVAHGKPGYSLPSL